MNLKVFFGSNNFEIHPVRERIAISFDFGMPKSFWGFKTSLNFKRVKENLYEEIQKVLELDNQ